MNRQPNRLAARPDHRFGGSEIDRGKPLSFRLNGRVIDGFAGDTVLSAMLANGIAAVGQRAGEPLGLGERFAPAVLPATAANDPAAALPMERMPALPGLDLVTLGGLRERLAAGSLAARIRHWLWGPAPTLNLRIDDPRAPCGNWRALQPRTPLRADVVVIGGGVAGMSAAIAAAAAADSVILVERTPTLGGNARYFGAVENEEPPDAAIARLAGELAGLGNVTVLVRTEAYALAGTTVRAHQIEVDGNRAVPRSLVIEAGRVVLATGAIECRPVFAGNRGPGVSGATEAFRLADRYGVWLGRRALFATGNNYGYRLALLAKDAGIDVQRIADTRLNPQSRFVDFVKASGITLASSLVPRAATPAQRGQAGLSVSFAVAIEGISRETNALHAEQLVTAGSWQPELSLWLMAGGRSRWKAAANWLAAEGKIEHVALAGSAAGYRNTAACMQSGQAAVAMLRGRAPKPVDDPQIEAVFETPDGRPPAIHAGTSGKSRPYLGSGCSFAVHEGDGARHGHLSAAAAQRQALELDEVAASVHVGELPAAEAGDVAAERCLGPGVIADSGWRLQVPAAAAGATVPAYLAGRFGAKPQMCVIGTADARAFEIGCLVFASSDEADPARAVGVVVGPAPGSSAGGLALIGKAAAALEGSLFARDGGGPVAIEVRERLKTEA